MRPDQIIDWLNEIARIEHNSLAHAFTRKRDDAKRILYKRNPNDFPATIALLGNGIPLAPEKRRGKDMLAKVREGVQGRVHPISLITTPTAHVRCEVLTALQAAG